MDWFFDLLPYAVILLGTYAGGWASGFAFCELKRRGEPQGCYECANRKRWEAYERAGLPPVHIIPKETEH